MAVVDKMRLYCTLAGFLVIYVGLCLEMPEPVGRVDCKESRIDKNITLIEGRNAGRFLKANKSISNMKQCVAQCCGVGGCDLAFMVNNQCYSVICESLESCAPKKNRDGKMRTMVAYVAKKYTQKCKNYQHIIFYAALCLIDKGSPVTSGCLIDRGLE